MRWSDRRSKLAQFQPEGLINSPGELHGTANTSRIGSRCAAQLSFSALSTGDGPKMGKSHPSPKLASSARQRETEASLGESGGALHNSLLCDAPVCDSMRVCQAHRLFPLQC